MKSFSYYWRGLRSRDARTLRYTDPLHAGRHPFQTYLLALCVVSSIPLILDASRDEGNVMTLLPWPLAVIWGVNLSVGSAIALAGSYWPIGRYATALTMERIGLVMAGTAGVVYGIVIIVVLGPARAVAGLIVLGFGLSCLARSRDIGAIMQRALAKQAGEATVTPRTEIQEFRQESG